MGVFLFDFIAILLYWKLADRTRLKELFPLLMTSVFVRFLDHYIVIDWLHLWTIFGPSWFTFWVPLSANLTVWPVTAYLFFQYLPERNKWVYGACWVATMVMYMQLLLWLHVFTMNDHWNMYMTIGTITAYYFLLYGVWYWLTQQSNKKTTPREQPGEPRLLRFRKAPLR